MGGRGRNTAYDTTSPQVDEHSRSMPQTPFNHHLKSPDSGPSKKSHITFLHEIPQVHQVLIEDICSRPKTRFNFAYVRSVYKLVPSKSSCTVQSARTLDCRLCHGQASHSSYSHCLVILNDDPTESEAFVASVRLLVVRWYRKLYFCLGHPLLSTTSSSAFRIGINSRQYKGQS